jgi:hypothetical protein
MTIEELLQDRVKLLKLLWIGFITSIIFIGIGVIWILNRLL